MQVVGDLQWCTCLCCYVHSRCVCRRDVTIVLPPAFSVAQVVVDAFDPSVLVSDCATHVFDFSTMQEAELHDIRIPLDLLVGESLVMTPHMCDHTADRTAAA